MYTYKDLWQAVLRYFDLASETGGSDVELAKGAVQAAHAQRCGEENWKFLISPVFSLSVVSGTQEYILPHDNFRRMFQLYDPSRRSFCTELSDREVPYSDILPDEATQTGFVDSYQTGNFSPVKSQPDAATLTLTSSTAEPNAPTLYIEGEDADGNTITVELAKDATSSEQFSRVTYYAKTADFIGTLTLTDGDGNVLVVLSPTQYAKQYPILKFVNIPNAAATMRYRFVKQGTQLSRDYDVPSLPYPDSYVLVYDALLDLSTYNELDSESVNIWREKQLLHYTNLMLRKMDNNTIGGTANTINSLGDFN